LNASRIRAKKPLCGSRGAAVARIRSSQSLSSSGEETMPSAPDFLARLRSSGVVREVKKIAGPA
jgi:hypothetical protein